MDHAVQAVAQGVRRRVAGSGGKVRRKAVAVLAYFGGGSGPQLETGEIAAALAAAGVLLKPPLADAAPDDVIELRLDRKVAPLHAAGGNIADAEPSLADGTRLHFVADLVDRIAPAVVHIFTAEGQGSGFALEAGGYIITNAHVIGEAAEVSVKFKEGYFRTGEVKGIDPLTDLAILGVEDVEPEVLSLRPLKSVRVGESVVAIGSPVGLEWSVSAGIVSGMNRTMRGPEGRQIDYMIQTDADINPGNSGGPLIAWDATVVGVNACSLTAEGVTGLNFAIPSDTVRSVYDEIREHGEVRRAAIGASVTSAAFFGKDADRWGQDGGARVTKVVQGGPAARAGLSQGDIVLSFDGELVDEPGDVFRILGRERIGRECAVAFIRENRLMQGAVEPESRPSPGS